MTHADQSNPQWQSAWLDFGQNFRLNELHLADCGGWSLSLRPAQITLGAMVLSVRSGKFNFADLTAQETTDMGAGFALAEQLARASYGAVRINILCLMMQDPIVHFHILPRYDHDINVGGQIWRDTDWPTAPTIRPIQTPEPMLQGVLGDMRHAIAPLLAAT